VLLCYDAATKSHELDAYNGQWTALAFLLEFH
jgi:hypothetical protein